VTQISTFVKYYKTKKGLTTQALFSEKNKNYESKNTSACPTRQAIAINIFHPFKLKLTAMPFGGVFEL
jgi:hypothetical protein